MARPTIEPSEEIKKRICEALRIGASLEHAAHTQAFSRRTLQRWMGRGKSEGEDGHFFEFQQQIEKAQAELVIFASY